MPLRIFKKNPDDSFYFHETEKQSKPTEEEELVLAKQMLDGGPEAIAARETLICSQLENVILIAEKYVNLGVLSMEDLYCEGNLGLLAAVESFDPNKGNLTTYARFWIEKYIKQALTDERRLSSGTTGDRHERMMNELRVYLNERRERNDGKAIEPFEWVRFIVHLEDKIDKMDSDGAESIHREDVIRDNKADNPEEKLISKELEQSIQKILEGYGEEERTAINMYFGLAGEETLSLNEISKKLEISENQTRRIITKMLRMLRSDPQINDLRGILREE